jgi:cytochrome c-type biogenesis protein CcmE
MRSFAQLVVTGFLFSRIIFKILANQLVFGLTLQRLIYEDKKMKTTHIIILIAIAAGIGILIAMTTDLSTYDTIDSAKQKKGKYLHLIAKLDTTNGKQIEYDALKNPNYLGFHIVDSLGGTSKVVYMKGKPPTDMERSERMVLKGKMTDSAFVCDDILIKCPSKYNDTKANISSNTK